MPLASSQSDQSNSSRWIILLCAAALLHLLLISWAGGHIGMPLARPAQPNIITAQLHQAPALVQPSAAPAPPKPAAKPVVKARRRAPAPEMTAPTPPGDAMANDAAAPASAAGMEVPGTSVETASEVPLADASADPVKPAVPPTPPGSNADAANAAAAPLPEPKRYRSSPPPSAELKYDVQALREGKTVYGRGKINWQANRELFRIDGEAGVLFFTVFNFSSEGTVGASGIEPVLYTEKRFRKSATNTHFQRERNTISFSASTNSYPRRGGEQDRASIVWQLAGIGRADDGVFAPGAEIDLFVAGARDAEVWRIHVVGQEQIDTGTGKMLAWHVTRAPDPGSYDKSMDIWLAPQQDWYPVKLRETEKNGDYLEMSLSGLSPGGQQ